MHSPFPVGLARSAWAYEGLGTVCAKGNSKQGEGSNERMITRDPPHREKRERQQILGTYVELLSLKRKISSAFRSSL